MVLTKCDLVDSSRLQTVLGEVRELLALALPGLRPPCRQKEEEEEEEEEEALEVGEVRVGTGSRSHPHALPSPML